MAQQSRWFRWTSGLALRTKQEFKHRPGPALSEGGSNSYFVPEATAHDLIFCFCFLN